MTNTKKSSSTEEQPQTEEATTNSIKNLNEEKVVPPNSLDEAFQSFRARKDKELGRRYPEPLTGTIVAIITPLTDDGEVDYPSLKRLVNHLCEGGVDAIVACGTTGETTTLTEEEHMRVIKSVKDYARGRTKIIAGTGSNNTAKAIELTKKAEKIGVDACLTVVPYYNKPSQEGLFQHFKAIAESTALPQILYNVPSRTATSLDIDTIARLAKIPNIVGIKDAHPDLSRISQIVHVTRDYNFVHLCGDDAICVTGVRLGSSGIVSVTGNILPKEMVEIMNEARFGDFEKAVALNSRLMNLHLSLFLDPNPTPVKWAAKRLELINSAKQRLPLLPISPDTRERVAFLLYELGVAPN